MTRYLFPLLGLMMGCGSAVDLSSNGQANTNPDNCIHNVYKHKPEAWLLKNVELHLAFYGAYWTQDQGDLYTVQYDWSALMAGAFLQRLGEYQVGSGTLDNQSYNIGTSLTGASEQDQEAGTIYKIVNDADIMSELNKQIAASYLPLPNDNTLYAIMLPPSVLTPYLQNNDFEAYHGHASYNGQRYTYAFVSYGNTVNDTNAYLSHEIYEAATNPDNGSGWYDDSEGEGEVADLCVGNYTPDFTSQVQKVWSQVLCVCQ